MERGPARARIRAAFLATSLKLADTSSSLVMRELDAYAAAWSAAHREACLATRVREEQTEDLMALRMTCLERRRVELAATVDILERPDARLSTAPQLADTLTRLGTAHQRKRATDRAVALLERALDPPVGRRRTLGVRVDQARAGPGAPGRGPAARASVLGGEARAEAEAAGDAKTLDDATTWLAEHRARR